MTRRTLYTALLALFVGSLAGVPLQAQTQEQGVPVSQNERAPDRVVQPVTVRVRNNNWLDMRVYVETETRGRWPLGHVTGLSTARFEIPDHMRADLSDLTLVAAPIGSRQWRSTDRLHTWPGALVDWTIGATLGLSFATVS